MHSITHCLPMRNIFYSRSEQCLLPISDAFFLCAGRSASYPAEVAAGYFSFCCSSFFFLNSSHHTTSKELQSLKCVFHASADQRKKNPTAHLFLSYAKCRNSSRILKHMSNHIKWVNSRLLISCMRGTALREVWSFGIVLHRSQLIGTLHNAVRGSGCYRLLLRE